MNHTTALSFLNKGYQVVPLSRTTGRPIIKFKDRPITEELIKSINWLNCDFALLMRGVWCLDIDTHDMDERTAQELKTMLKLFGIDLLSVLGTDRYGNGLDGYSSIIRHELKDELINNFKRTYTELTASGGLHVLFKKREGVSYSQKIGVLDGVDVKANDNNYVKVYPSAGREILGKTGTLAYYEGEFENQLFSRKAEPIITSFGQSVVKRMGNHEGQEAYERVSNGLSNNRNDDLFKGACWALENGYDLSPLYNVVGSIKGNDEFTISEFNLTIESARRKVSYVNVRA